MSQVGRPSFVPLFFMDLVVSTYSPNRFINYFSCKNLQQSICGVSHMDRVDCKKNLLRLWSLLFGVRHFHFSSSFLCRKLEYLMSTVNSSVDIASTLCHDLWSVNTNFDTGVYIDFKTCHISGFFF